MKKLLSLFGLLILGFLVFSSCGKDEDPENNPEPQISAPEIKFGPNSIDTTITQGDSLLINVFCASTQMLDNFQIYILTENNTAFPIVEITGINEVTYAFSEYLKFPIAISGKLYAEITDINGKQSSTFFNIIVKEPVPQDLTPTITFVMGGEDTTILLGETLAFSVVCSSNPTSGKKLDKYEIYMIVDNVNTGTLYDSTDIDNNVFAITNIIPTAMSPVAFEGRIYAKITDVDGESSQVSFNLTVEEATTPLEGEQDLEWQRIAGNPGTGLEMFGLKWVANAKEINAIIQKDGADKFVQLNSEDWINFSTKEDLMDAVEAAQDLGDNGYRGVSAEASGTYDDVLAVMYMGEYYIIHITEGTLVIDPVNGTTITINGMYNK